MIVVLTPEFLCSGHCDFQAKFALALSPSKLNLGGEGYSDLVWTWVRGWRQNVQSLLFLGQNMAKK